MQKATQQVGILYQNVLSLCKYFITLTALPGLYLSTSGVCSTCMGPLLTGTYQLHGESAEVCTEGVHQELEFCIGMCLRFSHATYPPLPAEDTI